MKMRSIALVAAVVIGTVGMVSAEQKVPSRPSEAALGGTTGVPARPVSPAPISTAPGMMPGAAMPMTPGMPPMAGAPGMMQRMPTMPYGSGYLTPEQAMKQELYRTGGQLAGSVVATGTKIGEVYATGDAEAKKQRSLSQIKIDEARELARIEEEKAQKLYAQQQAAVHKSEEAKKIIKTMIRDETMEAKSLAQKEISGRNTQMTAFRNLIRQASTKGINVEDYQRDLDAANDIVMSAQGKQKEATDKLSQALSKADDTLIDSINLLFNQAVDEVRGVDLSSSINQLRTEISPRRK